MDNLGDRLAWLAAAIIFLGILTMYDAKAAPLAPDEQQCSHLSRYALVARSLAAAHVSKDTARDVLQTIYQTDAKGNQLAELVLERAYQDTALAGVFATQFEAACLGHRGGSGMQHPPLRAEGKALLM